MAKRKRQSSAGSPRPEVLAFLHDIKANPDDDAPRLVFAPAAPLNFTNAQRICSMIKSAQQPTAGARSSGPAVVVHEARLQAVPRNRGYQFRSALALTCTTRGKRMTCTESEANP